MKYKKKIAIIGPYPKPYGGISVYIKRILTELDRMEVDYDFFNTTKYSQHIKSNISFFNVLPIFRGMLRLTFNSYDLIHYNSPNILGRLYLMLLAMVLRKNVYIHVHGASLHDALESKFILFLIKKMVHSINIIADNEDIYTLAKGIGARKVFLIDAFVPPSISLDSYHANQYRKLENIDFFVSMVGWFAEYKERDLYGFDIVCEAVKILNEDKYINMHIMVSVNGISSNTVYNDFLKLKSRFGLDDNFTLILEEVEEIWPLFLSADVFIRPTVSDGSAVSIKESLWLGTPVIASDCTKREQGVELFKCGSGKDLSLKLKNFYKNKRITIDEKIINFENKKFDNKLFKEVYEI